MSRFLIAGITIVVLSQLVAAQSGPTEIHYDLNTFHTYMLSPTGVDWEAAQAYSRTLGGHLASITDLGERNFINARYAGHPRFWIGLSDAQTEGTFVWDSGEPYVYANWCGLFEPNNAGGVEDHVEAFHTPTGFCWNDISSPYSGTASAPNRALIELPFGDRVNFEIGSFGACIQLPSPLGAPGDSEGVSWNGAGIASMHNAVYAMLPTGVPNVTWPVEGNVYVLVPSNGPVAVPLGGPFPRPAAAVANEVRIPIPIGAKGVSYAWEFLTAEDSSGIYNDGISIAVVGADGQLILDLTYADTTSPKETNVTPAIYCSSPPLPVLPTGASGPQTACHLFPPLPFPAYLSIVSWNGSDNALPSAAALDAIQFWGTGKFKLAIKAPVGPGSISLNLSGGGPFNVYTTAVSLNQGAFPYGWLFGVDIGFDMLLAQMASGPPFHGTLSGGGVKFFSMLSGVPSGLPIYAVSLQFTPAGPFGGSFVSATAPEFFLTP